MPSQESTLKWVLVAGTGSYNLEDRENWPAECIGRELAWHGYGLVGGGWHGVDYVAASAFAAALNEAEPATPLSSRLIQVVARGNQPDFRGGHVIYVEEGPWEWLEPLRYANAAVLIGGAGGTYESYVFATQQRIPVFPLAESGVDAKRAYDEILAKWREIGPWGVRQASFASSLANPINSSEDAVDASLSIIRLLHDHFTVSDDLVNGTRSSIFFSYSHKDRQWLQAVRHHFSCIPDQQVTLWDDSLTPPGKEWHNAILHRMIMCRAAVLIVSPNFLGSEYIRKHELPFILKQWNLKHLQIFWILAEPTAMDDLIDSGLGKIQAAHNIERPLSVLPPASRSAVLSDVATTIVDFLRQ